MKFSAEFESAGTEFWRFRASRWADIFEPFTESPIETVMAVSLAMYAEEIGIQRLRIVAPSEPLESAKGCFIAPQRVIGDYRVDFIVGNTNAGARLVIECDGRDFHHARWEQISRDRQRDKAIEAAGYEVRRFPGVQIHTEPFVIATHVWADIAEAEFKAWGEAHMKYF